MCASTRSRWSLRSTGRLCRPARGRVRSRRHSRLVRARRPPPASGRPGVSRHPRLRGRAPVGNQVRRIPVARTGAGRRRGGARARARGAGRRRRHRLRARRAAAGGARQTAAPLDGSTSDDETVVAGALRAPWKWEKLIVDSAVIGGDPERWRRRLRGLRGEYRRAAARGAARGSRFGARRAASSATSPTSRTWPASRCRSSTRWPRGRAARRGESGWRSSAIWRRACCASPGRVQRVLGELRPMAAVGPVTLEEARGILAERLRTLDEQPPANRYGCVFVGTPQQLRGRVFEVVFVPALAERLFPQKPREDPMLLDVEMRVPLDAGLFVQDDRLKSERLMLRLAAGAATDAAVAVVSAARRQRRATAGAVVLHARRHARRHRPHPGTRRVAARRGSGGRRAARLAGAGGRRRRHRRRRARPVDAAGADRAATARPCAAMRTTCSV